MRKKLHYDVAIVGAGVAGLTAALTAADAGASVTVLAKGAVDTSNSWAAQGGVAAAIGPDDDPSLHAADTLAAGRGLCRESAVELLTREAPERIAELVGLGVTFDPGLAREGGHSRSESDPRQIGVTEGDVVNPQLGFLQEVDFHLLVLVGPHRYRLGPRLELPWRRRRRDPLALSP